MNQRTHSWVAIRSIALLEQEGKSKNLVALLKPYARKATVGAWIPDQVDAKRAGNATDCHIFKIVPYQGNEKERFTVKKKDLIKYLGMNRLTAQLLESDTRLDENWWVSPYKGDVSRPGQHLANRAMALSTMMKDLLIVGNRNIDSLIPGKVGFIKDVDVKARTRQEAAALYFFMLSHFVADAGMPCHCDGRKLAGYGNGLHKELEEHWSQKVGAFFEKGNLLGNSVGVDVLDEAKKIDGQFELDFQSCSVPSLGKEKDVWLEVMYTCRASFAVSNIIAPPYSYSYNDEQAMAPFDVVLGNGNAGLLKQVDKAVLHDAVLNTATIWKHVFAKVSKE